MEVPLYYLLIKNRMSFDTILHSALTFSVLGKIKISRQHFEIFFFFFFSRK